MLTVYEASAGSGKTFQLVARYLDLLMKNPTAYRNILAVTFTNKATNEMKGRILDQLYRLSTGKSSRYLDTLITSGGFTEALIRKQAKASLKNILHDYSRFSVSTIDSFTQRILKAFNREMGITPNYLLELDNDRILEESVDRLLSKIGNDPALKKWLVRFSKEKINENRSHRIEDDIRLLGNELFKEKFQIFFPDEGLENSPFDREAIESFRKELDMVIFSFEQTMKNGGASGMSLISKHGFTVNDFSYNTSGIAGYFKNLAEGTMKEPGTRVLAASKSAEVWITRKHEDAKALMVLVENFLLPKLKEILDFYLENRSAYLSAKEAKKQLRTLGILSDLKNEVRGLMLERGGIQLSDSNLLLSRIIENSDAPFIYEKSGIRFSHFLLDEFQDTSMMQWDNFKPLIRNALAEGDTALLVGDVKQSVYRWRNSDWNILASKIYTDFHPDQVTKIALTKNWRSLDQIITFNGRLFEILKNSFQQLIFNDVNDEAMMDRFASLYQNLWQDPAHPDSDPRGLAEISFLPEDRFEERSCELIVEQVKCLQDQGLKASDIAILIRKNQEGEKIIEAFLRASEQKENERYNLNVLSNESLFLKTSRGVHFVMLVIECLVNEEPVIPRAALLHLWRSWLKPLLLKSGDEKENDVLFALDKVLGDSTSIWDVNQDFNQLFEAELGKKIEQLRPKLVLSSIDEAVMEICACFGLFSIRSEWPFLQTLIDQSADLKMTLSNDLSNFLHWWQEKGISISVRVNDEIDSIRLLTVHKAKGLEYEAVIIPFFNWSVTSWSGNQAPLLWCKSMVPPYNRFPLLPVRANKQLAGTIFRDDYFEEILNSYIDTMNLIYVAFTRAKAVLYVHGRKAPERKNGMAGRSVNELLQFALEAMATMSDFSGCWNDDKSRFRFGELPAFHSEGNPDSQGWVHTYRFFDLRKRIALRSNSDDFLIGEGSAPSSKNRGKLIHEILSGVVKADDLHAACLKAYREGIITSAEQLEISSRLKEKLADPAINHWFDGSFTVLNERNLISPDGVFRPDRMMVSGKYVVVVDYKSGLVKLESYRKQVQKYARLLQACGFERVEGFLWYINLDEIEQVV